MSHMYVMENVPLSGYSTMRLGGPAMYLTEITSQAEIPEAAEWAETHKVPLVMIGDGSNIIWNDDGFKGLVVVNKISGFEAFKEDDQNYYLTIGAGENWDSVVARTVQMGLTGIEQLSLIPGTTGATPVQNVGAYGREIADVLTTVQAYDLHTRDFVTLAATDCAFGYRSSRFKTTDRGRFLIINITLHLTVGAPQPPFYASLQAYLHEHNISQYTPQNIREAVIAIRSSKLPDPKQVANNGSFFANPIVQEGVLTQIQADYPNVVHWELPGGKVKLSAAWLVESAGFKDVHDEETGMGTWPKQALVLVNEKASRTAQLLAFRKKIVDAVQQKFGVQLVQEPELMESS